MRRMSALPVSKPQSPPGQHSQAADPSGRLRIVECADDVSGMRIFAVYQDLMLLHLFGTREQSSVFVRLLVTEAAWRDADCRGAP